jgi:hypothetical protein
MGGLRAEFILVAYQILILRMEVQRARVRTLRVKRPSKGSGEWFISTAFVLEPLEIIGEELGARRIVIANAGEHRCEHAGVGPITISLFSANQLALKQDEHGWRLDSRKDVESVANGRCVGALTESVPLEPLEFQSQPVPNGSPEVAYRT